MIEFNDILDIMAGSFFGGSVEIAGLVIYCAVLCLLFAFTKNVFQTLILALPVTFIFSVFGALPLDLTIMLIIVAVLGLAFSARGVWRK